MELVESCPALSTPGFYIGWFGNQENCDSFETP
jgi:hypothetical protein